MKSKIPKSREAKKNMKQAAADRKPAGGPRVRGSRPQQAPPSLLAMILKLKGK